MHSICPPATRSRATSLFRPHLLSLGDPKRAAEMVAEAERAERERASVA
jgi:hypothetical protein